MARRGVIGSTEGKWYAGKPQQEHPASTQYITIGTFSADDHYEDAICQVFDGNHDAKANAALIVAAVNEVRGFS